MVEEHEQAHREVVRPLEIVDYEQRPPAAGQALEDVGEAAGECVVLGRSRHLLVRWQKRLEGLVQSGQVSQVICQESLSGGSPIPASIRQCPQHRSQSREWPGVSEARFAGYHLDPLLRRLSPELDGESGLSRPALATEKQDAARAAPSRRQRLLQTPELFSSSGELRTEHERPRPG